jgi:hypothetical protein
MKKLFSFFIAIAFLAIFLSSCNKDDTTPTGTNTTNTGVQSKTFNSNPNLNKIISNTGPVFDTINASVTDNLLSNNISDVKITLGDVSNVEVDKIKFSLIHGTTEVAVVDLLTKTGTGNFTNTVLWDSATIPIDQGQSPYTGTFKPQHPLRNFVNADPAGNWIIKITYTGSIKSGVIKSWGITISYRPTLQTPTITRDYIPIIGNNWSFKFCDTNVTTGITGENVLWDYSSLILYPDTYTDEYVSPVSPMLWHFPQSNIAKRNFQLNGNFMTFFNSDLNAGLFQMFGEADSTSSGLRLMKFDPPMTNLNGTFTFNSNKSDSGYLYAVDLGTNHNGKYRQTVLGDGWGRILLPNGVTYNNVLRIKSTLEMMDTISGSNLKFMNLQVYSWYAMGYKFPVFRITTYMEYSMGGQSIWEKKVYYTTQNVPINKK